MQRIFRCWIVVALMALVGCGTDIVEPVILPEDVDTTPQQGRLGIVNAIPDSPILVIEWISTTRNPAFADNGIVEIPFGEGALFALNEDTYAVRLSYPNLAGESIAIQEYSTDAGSDPFVIANDTQITIVAAGALDNPSFTIVRETEYQHGELLPADGTPLISDPEIHFAHAAEGIDPVDFYFTQNDVNVEDADPIASLSLGEVSSLSIVEERSDYRIRVTPAGAKAPVMFDTGAFELAASRRALVPIFNYFGPGDSLIEARFIESVAINFANGSNPAAVRIINLVGDVAEIDVYEGDIDANPEFAGLAYGAFPPHETKDGGSVFLNVTPSGASEPLLFEGTETFSRGTFATLLISGLFEDPLADNNSTIGSTLIVEENRAIAGAVQVRYYNAAPSGETVNVYLVEPGATITGATPFLTAVQVGSSGVSFLAPGTYDLVVERSTEPTGVVYGPETITLEDDSIYTVLARDLDGGTPLDVDILRNQVP